MKIKIALLYIMVLFFSLWAKDSLAQKRDNYYYYRGEKVYLAIDRETVCVTYEQQEFAAAKEYTGELVRTSYTRSKVIPVDSKSKARCGTKNFTYEIDVPAGGYDRLVKELKSRGDVVHVSPSYSFREHKGTPTGDIYVKLLVPDDVNTLYTLADKYSMEVLGYNKFMPLWFTLSCTKQTPYNSIEMANVFYETRLFECSEPALLYPVSYAINDWFFNKQWGLKNTGQYNGICPSGRYDINVESAWEITTGSPDVRIAVMDDGIDISHIEFVGNIHNAPFDVTTGDTSTFYKRGTHGTAVAGVIAARQNNNHGISGIAPSCKLFPIITSGLDEYLDEQDIADGFNWAWTHGADIINCSWGNYPYSDIIKNSIDETLTHGRGGRGSAVVFCSHNQNRDSIAFPADCNPLITVVGAITPDGNRKKRYPASCDGFNGWGSNYGEQLDIMAPGVKIVTTDWWGWDTDYDGFLNYRMDWEGTSAAAPHVAGVAALMLSVNPSLTVKDVNDIIEQTAQKPAYYTWSYENGRPNGKRHPEMGYGIVDAYAAVSLAQAYCTENINFITPIIQSSDIQVQNKITGASSIADSLEVNFKARTVHLKPGFTISSGKFSAVVDPCGIPATTNAPKIDIDYETYYANILNGNRQEDITSSGRDILKDAAATDSFAAEVFPNPASGHIYISHALHSDYYLYDLTGRCVLKGRVNSENAHPIETSMLQPGCYILQLGNDRQPANTFRIFLQ